MFLIRSDSILSCHMVMLQGAPHMLQCHLWGMSSHFISIISG